jgi:unsaturated chondroitin disaccharide hydrolase
MPREKNYIIANVPIKDFVPLVDFRSPAEPVAFDTTAGVCAACGLLEIADAVGKLEASLYRNAALSILQATERRYCNWNVDENSIVANGGGSYHGRNGDYEVPILYGDYFL